MVVLLLFALVFLSSWFNLSDIFFFGPTGREKKRTETNDPLLKSWKVILRNRLKKRELPSCGCGGQHPTTRLLTRMETLQPHAQYSSEQLPALLDAQRNELVIRNLDPN